MLIMPDSSKQSIVWSRIVGLTMEEPAPWYLACWANSPITATFLPNLSGRMPSSFLSSTIDSSATFWDTRW
ncbi:hypothetical protein D1872_335050 [compost metagenome]